MPKKARAKNHTKSNNLIFVSPETKAAMDAYCAEYGVTHNLLVWQLIEFYRLERLDWLIQRVRDKYLIGLNLTERSHLAVLYVLLAEIDHAVGLATNKFD